MVIARSVGGRVITTGGTELPGPMPGEEDAELGDAITIGSIGDKDEQLQELLRFTRGIIAQRDAALEALRPFAGIKVPDYATAFRPLSEYVSLKYLDIKVGHVRTAASVLASLTDKSKGDG